MEESGQGAPYPEVIDEKGLRTRKRVFIETSITLGFWGLILYLLTIFITFIFWLFGIQLVYSEIFTVGFQEMKRLFENAAGVTSIVALVLLIWSYYNVALIRIKGERRNTQVSICFDSDMAKFFHIDPDVLEKIKNCPRISVRIKQGAIIFSETSLLPSQDQ
jgi:poly-beta-1,6-N-acetyl-D-glucosamine biosynthesis protein PgaD